MTRLLCVYVAASAACVASEVTVCSDGRICPATSVCDDAHGGCASPDQLAACSGVTDGATCTFALPDDGVCDQGVCISARCGDGY